jgi:hypothetical protein
MAKEGWKDKETNKGKSFEEIAAEITIAWISAVGTKLPAKINGQLIQAVYDGIYKRIHLSHNDIYKPKIKGDD